MKIIKLVCVLIILSSTTVLAQNSSIKQASDMYSDYWTLYNSKDFDNLSKYWDKNAQGFIANHVPFLLNGKNDFIELHNDLRNVDYLNMRLKDPIYTSYGENTVTCSSYYIWRIAAADGFETISGRHTAVLVKTEKGWKLANMHFSKIFPN